MEDQRHEAERARTTIAFAVLAIVCMLAGFVVGVARSHPGQSPRPVTVKAIVALGGSR